MENRIRILATSDVHGYIYPYSYANNEEENIGYARISTLVEALRDENTILIDNGDIIEGSPLMFYHMHNKKDEVSPVAKVLNAMEYDYINIGNHDFNYGEKVLLKHLNELNAPCITNNILYHNKTIGATYAICEIANKKVAIFGLTTQYIPNWEKKKNIAHSKFLDACITAKKTVEHLKSLENPDYIICAYHGGFERDLVNGYPTEDLTRENEGYEILKTVSGIDVLITGHQHRSLAGNLFGKAYTQTKDRGAELACIDIYTDTGVIEPRVLKADTEADKKILTLVQEEENQCQKWLDTPLGTTKVDLKVTDEDEARLYKSQVITFLNMVAKEATGADLCANALFDRATGFSKNITMRDLVSTYVFPNTLVIKKVTGKVLREYLEKCAEYFTISNGVIAVSPRYLAPKPMKYNYDMVDGVEYTIKVSNDVGHRITSLTKDGKEVSDTDEFTLCVNNYRATGGGNFNMLKDAPVVKEIPSSMVELLADYIMEHKVVDFVPVHNIKVEK